MGLTFNVATESPEGFEGKRKRDSLISAFWAFRSIKSVYKKLDQYI